MNNFMQVQCKVVLFMCPILFFITSIEKIYGRLSRLFCEGLQEITG